MAYWMPMQERNKGWACPTRQLPQLRPASNYQSDKLQRRYPLWRHGTQQQKRNLINTKCTHWRQTRNNTPGDVPVITRVTPQIIPTDVSTPHKKQRLTCVLTQKTYPTIEFTPGPIIIPPYPVPGGIRASAHLISQHTLNILTIKEALNPPRAFTPKHFVHKLYEDHISYPKLHTFCITHGPSYNGQNDHQLQMTDAWSQNCWSLTNGVW